MACRSDDAEVAAAGCWIVAESCDGSVIEVGGTTDGGGDQSDFELDGRDCGEDGGDQSDFELGGRDCGEDGGSAPAVGWGIGGGGSAPSRDETTTVADGEAVSFHGPSAPAWIGRPKTDSGDGSDCAFRLNFAYRNQNQTNQDQSNEHDQSGGDGR